MAHGNGIPTILEFTNFIRLQPDGPYGLTIRDAFLDSRDAYGRVIATSRRNLHLEALYSFCAHWRDPGTPLCRLAQPSFALRLPGDTERPTLTDLLEDEATTVVRFAYLFDRIMTGNWFDDRWVPMMGQGNRTGEDIARDFILDPFGRGPQDAVRDPNAVSLCCPIRREAVNPHGRSEPYDSPQRTYLSRHRDGYVRVNFGTDDQGRAVQVYLHTLVCMAYHGPPAILQAATANKAAVYQQVGHICGNPWCISFRHLEWCDKSKNALTGMPPTYYLEQRHPQDRNNFKWRWGNPEQQRAQQPPAL